VADALAKVRPGQSLRIPAAAYNAFVDAAKADRGLRQDAQREAIRAQTVGLTPVRNATASAIPRFGVLGVDGPLFLPGDALDSFQNRVAIVGVAPTTALHEGKFVIALEPIAAGGLGMACAAGVCIARVEFPMGSDDAKFADIADNETGHLKSGDRGAAQILWREPGDGVRWAILRFGAAGAPSVFPVELTQVGGVQGAAVTPASWTYDIADPVTAESLGTSADPTTAPHRWRRPEVGPVSPANFGIARRDENSDLELLWINETAESMWAFPITLTQTGGAQATASTPATWQYTVSDAVSGLTLATSVDPAAPPHEWRRPTRGLVTPATHGYASLTAGGVLVIGWCNETVEDYIGTMFPIALALTENVPGSATTPAGHLYDIVHGVTGELLLSAFTDPTAPPHRWKRPAVGVMSPADLGFAYRLANNTIVIAWINEIAEHEACAAAPA
jgi:hypothetical protein